MNRYSLLKLSGYSRLRGILNGEKRAEGLGCLPFLPVSVTWGASG
jgi:hypothetical protein